ncbi:hypothetical protein E5673_08600 [Sphingomonas sp. PAMC26645]|uniref:hypothetical protein n=1 Tax=Sphingomonas sp. PAMC26645 TaxID=2565555 RepID=UPI00109E15C5|nr:hypothetical protein [Sphingomonas sp. PAMC26645]QCB42284.1 hypothetical protein E5673_08600 [Sphingomonas sp. PAMC26645]
MTAPATLAEQLARVAVDATDHPADAVTALMKAGGIILQRTFGADEAVRIMAEVERDWTKLRTGSDVVRH